VGNRLISGHGDQTLAVTPGFPVSDSVPLDDLR
jgi:hypothetical protein